MHAEHLLATAHMDARRRQADHRRVVLQARATGRPATPHVARVALGQLLVRTGERLSGTSPGPYHA